MRNKKSKTILYIIVAVIVLGFVFVGTRSFTPDVQTIEHPIENDFTNQ